jgi:uncharacterized membrane protein
MKVTVTVEVGGSAQKVWDILMAVEAWPEWTASINSVERLDPGPLILGSRVRIKQPKLPSTVWTVSEMAEGVRFSWTAAGLGSRTIASHQVETTPTGARVNLSIRQGGMIGGFFGHLYSRLTRRYVTMEADGLKQRAETST